MYCDVFVVVCGCEICVVVSVEVVVGRRERRALGVEFLMKNGFDGCVVM